MHYSSVTAHSAVIKRGFKHMHIIISYVTWGHQSVFHSKKGFYVLHCIFSNKYPTDLKRDMFMLRSNATRPLSCGPKRPLRNRRLDAHLGWCAWAPGHHHSSLWHIWPLFHNDQQSSHACQMVDHAYKTKKTNGDIWHNTVYKSYDILHKAGITL